ncbi:uncharacterized protein DUF1127 [Shimia isoporae]|uniref:Uncharacterized protein DUF1127 n=1 Tax=Shimia isoporae TaxID=647720 RepID=A0A4R1MZZ3_9RHOB|nr:DUF1127 domain-containing protein [Shimia isoporae]TCK98866.1 uncharacterized protein DUF1127 [Shimia isoporae]
MQHAPALYIEPVDFVGRIQHAIEDFRFGRKQNKAFRNTVRELSGLSDHELADIGVERSDIVAVARECAAS